MYSPHSLNYLSRYTYRGALGAGSSANVFDASTPITIWLERADILLNIRASICSSELVYVSAIVTLPLLLGEPLHTHLALKRVTCSLTTYVHSKLRMFAQGGNWQGGPNVSCISY